MVWCLRPVIAYLLNFKANADKYNNQELFVCSTCYVNLVECTSYVLPSDNCDGFKLICTKCYKSQGGVCYTL